MKGLTAILGVVSRSKTVTVPEPRHIGRRDQQNVVVVIVVFVVVVVVVVNERQP